MYQADNNDPQGNVAWLPLHYAGFALQMDDFGMYISHPSEDLGGKRFLEDVSYISIIKYLY